MSRQPGKSALITGGNAGLGKEMSPLSGARFGATPGCSSVAARST